MGPETGETMWDDLTERNIFHADGRLLCDKCQFLSRHVALPSLSSISTAVGPVSKFP